MDIESQIKIGDEIGSGGYGTVYEATLGETKVAVKQIDIGKRGIRCLNEVILMKSISSQYLTPILGTYVKSSKLHIVMPLASLSLRSYIKKLKDKEVSLSKLKKWSFILVCSLHLLHLNGIIHGDIKSSNVLLFKNIPKLADLGLSFFLTSPREGYTGTLRYRSIEQFGEQWSFPVDIWALGCTLFEVAFGITFIPDQNKVVPNIDERHVNVLIDWGSRHPGGPDLPNFVCKTKDPYLPVILPSKWSSVSYANFREFLLPMLFISPEKRPTTTELLQSSYFSEFVNPKFFKFNLSNSVSKETRDYFESKCSRELQVKLALNIYSKLRLKNNKFLLMKTCLWIAGKLIRKKSKKYFDEQPEVIHQIELHICKHLNFKLLT